MTLLRLSARVFLGASLLVTGIGHLLHRRRVLVVWALWSTGAWAAWRGRKSVEENQHVRA